MTAIWILMLVTNLLFPLTMIVIGRYFQKGALPSVNRMFGYRTAMSMKNKETWEFAHRHFGKRWFVIGLILLPVTVLVMLPFLGSSDDAVALVGCILMCVLCVPMILPILSTERALKSRFDENGQAFVK